MVTIQEWSRGGDGSLALPKLQIPAFVLAKYPSFMPNVNPECKLLTPYVGRFYKATCVTPCILKVGVRTKSQYNHSHRVPVFSSEPLYLLFIQKCSFLFYTNQCGTRRRRQDATFVMFPACPVDHVAHYTTTVLYVRTCRILDPASAFLHTLMIPTS